MATTPDDPAFTRANAGRLLAAAGVCTVAAVVALARPGVAWYVGVLFVLGAAAPAWHLNEILRKHLTSGAASSRWMLLASAVRGVLAVIAGIAVLSMCLSLFGAVLGRGWV